MLPAGASRCCQKSAEAHQEIIKAASSNGSADCRASQKSVCRWASSYFDTTPI
jgi:hypothetical protein